MQQSKTLQLSYDLLRRQSVTPEDLGCQGLMLQRLKAAGFEITELNFADVTNFWALRKGDRPGPTFVFAGHTDVVPTGDPKQWQSPPFEPEIRDGFLYGRGVADMKCALAAMVCACEDFLQHDSDFSGSIAFLITSDEEGPAINGTRKVVDYLREQNLRPEYCLVGEPSSKSTLGDVVKNGRRGSLHGYFTAKGIQGHVAYPHMARNPIHDAMPALAALCNVQWDQGNEYFPATTLQISNIQSGTGVSNVIPGQLEAKFNLRFSSELNADSIKTRSDEILSQFNLDYELTWELSGDPFITPRGQLLSAVEAAISSQLGICAEINTTGGTSDGRFIATLGTQVIELGLCNDSIHKIDERASVADINQLSGLYQQILHNILRV